MVGIHVHAKLAFFGRDLEKVGGKIRRSIFARAEAHIVYIGRNPHATKRYFKINKNSPHILYEVCQCTSSVQVTTHTNQTTYLLYMCNNNGIQYMYVYSSVC